MFDTKRLLSSGQVADAYLLGLAIRHAGRLATLDRRLIVDPVYGGASGLRLI
jgi:predicted nucleic acid-binding protein